MQINRHCLASHIRDAGGYRVNYSHHDPWYVVPALVIIGALVGLAFGLAF